MAYLPAQGPSREAEATARTLRRLPSSGSSFERIGHAVGALHGIPRDDVEDEFNARYGLPVKSHSVSLSVDRVAMPMAEPRARQPSQAELDAQGKDELDEALVSWMEEAMAARALPRRRRRVAQ
ncbi:MAG: hypothetical protein INH41_27595 [Myxococcaceae bacterium]|jgi:hypothetical protein|nr:hypothetical protein [Myxococcaceae bacterium]